MRGGAAWVGGGGGGGREVSNKRCLSTIFISTAPIWGLKVVTRYTSSTFETLNSNMSLLPLRLL